eukprot:PITA_24646
MNRTIQQMARAMLDESRTPATFWGEAAFVVVTILNKENVRVNIPQTPHELWYGNTPTVKYFKVFGSKCFIKRTDEKLGKFEPRADEGIILGYSSISKGYKCYNKILGKIVERIDVLVDEACKNPKQIKSIEYYDNEEDGDYFSTSNQNYIEEETNEAPEEEIKKKRLSPGYSLSSNDELAAVHQPIYRSMIGSLLYLIGTRPDIMYAIGIVGRFQVNLKESHLQVVKRIFKYLQGTKDFGLWYPRDADLTLHAYTDSDWVGSVDDRKSTSGGAFYMGSRLVSWFSKKQSSIDLSASEEEYVVVAYCCTQLLLMMQTLQEIQITCTPPISIICDNTSVISISKNPIMHSKSKNIPIKYHFLREQVLEQKVKLEYVPSKEQVVDIFTKPLPRETFEYLRQKLGVVVASSCC